MNAQELKEILVKHEKWLNDEVDGERADLQGADLQGVDLQGANLRGAGLRGAGLQGANLQGANLRGAGLRGAGLRGAGLQGADLRRVDLQGADIDFSCLPLWCGGLNFKIDERVARQLLYHVMNLMQYSELDMSIFKAKTYDFVNDSHLISEHGLPKIERNAK